MGCSWPLLGSSWLLMNTECLLADLKGARRTRLEQRTCVHAHTHARRPLNMTQLLTRSGRLKLFALLTLSFFLSASFCCSRPLGCFLAALWRPLGRSGALLAALGQLLAALEHRTALGRSQGCPPNEARTKHLRACKHTCKATPKYNPAVDTKRQTQTLCFADAFFLLGCLFLLFAASWLLLGFFLAALWRPPGRSWGALGRSWAALGCS